MSDTTLYPQQLKGDQVPGYVGFVAIIYNREVNNTLYIIDETKAGK